MILPVLELVYDLERANRNRSIPNKINLWIEGKKFQGLCRLIKVLIRLQVGGTAMDAFTRPWRSNNHIIRQVGSNAFMVFHPPALVDRMDNAFDRFYF